MFLLYTDVPESQISSFRKVSRDETDDVILTGNKIIDNRVIINISVKVLEHYNIYCLLKHIIMYCLYPLIHVLPAIPSFLLP